MIDACAVKAKPAKTRSQKRRNVTERDMHSVNLYRWKVETQTPRLTRYSVMLLLNWLPIERTVIKPPD